ncbi:FAD-dependent oxidoreductase [Pigmentiphaga soli]|uniref:FAD-dependent oxidoreductase n=1 Tax=Pigmentiphaga soli TaxID=1007095 RepID=A0ABP8GBC6_9BURK
MKSKASHRVVIVGGGAGGLELAVRLGRRYGAGVVTLVDATPFHVWKPSLHEVAAGTIDIHREGLSYAMLAHDNGFRFVAGRMTGADRAARQVQVDALRDSDGEEVLPARTLPYDTLVLCLGSNGNFFNTPGAEQYAVSLDSTASAERFRIELLKAVARKGRAGAGAAVEIAIVGGGATGVELAAELHEAGRTLAAYGLGVEAVPRLDMTLIESGPRILGPLPERVADAAREELVRRGVRVKEGCKVLEVAQGSLRTSGGDLPADLFVWAAGIKAPTLLRDLGLPVNAVNQLVVDDRLRTEDEAVYAFGDCAAAPWQGKTVPARAQAAHQQAAYLARVLSARIEGRSPPAEPFAFRDFGSLVSIGHAEGVGTLMGGLAGRRLLVEGWVARVMYASIHWSHYATVLGWWGATMRSLAQFFGRRSRPRVKLH